ncbi:unnamed protein product [Pleuronectes platessa]|uniref:Ig-like domain-containing protein n=1 Tax=Pleuronectes platessa TaxID=8262 RepID=A0A9N7YWN3_PLEPL|nr:unnamed protein product [Pleuronectes platessa]
MIKELSALILLTTLSLHQTAEVPQQIPLIVANLDHKNQQKHIYVKQSPETASVQPGNPTTLQCSLLSTNKENLVQYPGEHRVHWFRAGSGRSHPSFIYTQSSRRDEQEEKSCVYSLSKTIHNSSDAGTYYCAVVTCGEILFGGGTKVEMNHKNQQKHIYVKQSPETASVQPGNSTTLQCSLLSTNKENLVQCPGEHRVHWFRAGSGRSHPSFIYTQSSRRDEQEEKSCVYSLSKTIHNSSDAGTYYCAVVTCGEILFGGGTKVEMRQEQLPLVIVLGTLMLSCIFVMVALFLLR